MTIAYRITCTRITGETSRQYLSEWHTSLASALEAMAAHQQQEWDLVALVPQTVPSAERHGAWPAPGDTLCPQ